MRKIINIINIFSVILVIVTISKMFPLSFSAEENDNYDITLLGKDEENYVIITTPVYNDITELHLIDNADYFKVNPLHKDNDLSDNSKGTCTTVAMQMVMGYHNYYSDRRIIPENTIYNTTFLDKDFGKLEDHPLINTTVAFNLGKNSIGTTDDFYRKLYELNFIADIPVAGQTVWPVANGARRFISQYANDISDTIEIEGDIYSYEEVIEELNEGRPVVIGFNELFGEVNFHNVVAYGYAKYKGVDGYIVHWGHFYDKSFVWVPESWVGFQITMKVNHTHDYQPSFYDVSSVYRKLICTSCGCTTISPLYTVDTEANSILYSNYYMFGNVNIINT